MEDQFEKANENAVLVEHESDFPVIVRAPIPETAHIRQVQTRLWQTA